MDKKVVLELNKMLEKAKSEKEKDEIYQEFLKMKNMPTEYDFESVDIDEIREKSSDVFKMYPVNTVMLFGSYAKGDQTENSDIDMIVKNSDLEFLEMSRIRQQLSSKIGKKIDLISEEDVSDVFRFLIQDEEALIYEKQR